VVVEFPRHPQPRETRTFGTWKEHKDLDLVSASAEKVILEKVAPPVVLVNENGDLLYFTRPTGKYLEPPVGKANMNILTMAREGLGLELGIAIRKAITEKTKVTVNNVRVRTNDHIQAINLTVEPLKEPAPMSGLLMVVFEDVEEGPETKKLDEKSISTARLAEINSTLEKELLVTKQHLQSVVEDAETTQEELKSANEELQSTNEEMQSTNEELNTSREEMQSLNEELSTLNSELQAKNEELTQINSDLTNLLNSTQIPVLFLDKHLKIKRFTSQMTKIVNLIPSDVDRPVSDIAFNLKGESIMDMSSSVMESLIPKEDQVENREGRWYIRRAMPYRTIDNTIEGVVITFTDITERKILEDSFRKTISDLKGRVSLAEGIVENVKEPLMVLNGGLKVVKVNRSFYGIFHTKPEETIGKFIYDLGNGQWDIPELRRLLEEALTRNISIEDYLVEHDFPEIGKRRMLLNARWLIREGTEKQLILLAMQDVTKELCESKI
jgi:two-component system CheB/CheR fusion protein